MFLVVGLGNPGKQYESTRHNAGFLAVDELARRASADAFRDKFSALHARCRIGDHDVCLLKPQTFMNLSGQSVQPAAAFFKVVPRDIIVLHDELDLPFGEVRLKQGGGHAGHNGLRSIIERLSTPDFARVRIGIGRPVGVRDTASWVLSSFDGVERARLDDVLSAAVSATEDAIRLGVAAAMNRHNTRPR